MEVIMYENMIKRLFDISGSLIGLILLSPLFLLIAISIKMNSQGPVLFKQKRVGKNNSSFYLLKFRSMKTDTPRECPTHLLMHPDQYITSIGSFLRKTSLDELPQLLNIIRGDMSIVGPRPCLLSQEDLIESRVKNGSFAMRPGLTGLAQVKGRDELPIEIKANYDGIYKNHISFMFDIKIILATMRCVITKKGYQEGKK